MNGDIRDQWEAQGGQRLQWVLSKDAKLRLDKYLQNRLKGFSRSQVQKLIERGAVRVNDHLPKASTALHEGDVVDVVIPPRPSSDITPEPIPLDILYEDEDFVVVNKQAGLIIHPARSHRSGTLLNALTWHFEGKGTGDEGRGAREEGDEGLSNIGREDARPGVVHRLDQNTTGVIVVAKRDQTHGLLSRQFEQRTNLKVYLAVVHGCPGGGIVHSPKSEVRSPKSEVRSPKSEVWNPKAMNDERGTMDSSIGGALDFPIGKHPTIREAMAVRYDSTGKESLTLYRIRERYEGYTLVELELKSGRTHQIRVHLSYAGCPIVGDVIYGGEVVGQEEIEHPPRPAGARLHLNFARTKEQGEKIEEEAASRLAQGQWLMPTPALHASLLAIDHPVTGKRMTFTAPVPDPMRELIQRLRKRPAPGAVATSGYHLDLESIVPSP